MRSAISFSGIFRKSRVDCACVSGQENGYRFFCRMF